MVAEADIDAAIAYAEQTKRVRTGRCVARTGLRRQPSGGTVRRAVSLALESLESGETVGEALHRARSGVSIEVVWLILIIVRITINWWLENRKT